MAWVPTKIIVLIILFALGGAVFTTALSTGYLTLPFAPITPCDPSTHPDRFPVETYLNSTHFNSGNFVITLPTFGTCELLAIGVLIDFSNHTIQNPSEVFIRANYTSILNQQTSQVVSRVDITTLTDTSAVVEIAIPANTNIVIYSRGTMPLNYIVITDILELSHG